MNELSCRTCIFLLDLVSNDLVAAVIIRLTSVYKYAGMLV